MIKLIIFGRPVSQKNAKRVVPGIKFPITDKHVARWKKDAIAQLTAQWHLPKLVKPIPLGIVAYMAKGQSMDCDNLAAGPMDALEKAGVISNDNKFHPLIIGRARDWETPRIEIFIASDSAAVFAAVRDASEIGGGS